MTRMFRDEKESSAIELMLGNIWMQRGIYD